MTTYDLGAQTPTQSGGPPSEGGTQEQAKQAAQTAADEGAQLADAAKSEAQSVATDAKEQARNLAEDARSQLEAQSRSQLDNLVSTLQGFADDLEKMARGEGAGSGLAQDVVSQVGEHARSFSSQLRGQEPAQVLDQARDFARRRPGTFLLGALAAGVVAGRLARGAKDAHGGSASSSTGGGASTGAGLGSTGATQGGTAAGDPLAGTAAPAESPVYPTGAPTPGGTL